MCFSTKLTAVPTGRDPSSPCERGYGRWLPGPYETQIQFKERLAVQNALNLNQWTLFDDELESGSEHGLALALCTLRLRSRRIKDATGLK